MGSVGLAVLGVVDLSVPAAIRAWFHIQEDGKSERRPGTLCGIWILDILTAGTLFPRDRAPHYAPAILDAYPGGPAVDQPLSHRAFVGPMGEAAPVGMALFFSGQGGAADNHDGTNCQNF